MIEKICGMSIVDYVEVKQVVIEKKLDNYLE